VPAAAEKPLVKLVKGFSRLAIASLISQLIAFVALAYVARRVGATNLGAYTLALLLASYFNLVASVGVDYLAMRDLAKNKSAVGEIVGETLLLQGAMAAVMYVALLILAPVLVADHDVETLVPIVGLIMFTTTFTLDWALLALGRSTGVAVWRMVGQVVYAALIPLLVVGGRVGIERYAWLNILGLAVTAAGLLWVFWRYCGGRLRTSGVRALARRLRRSLPFGYSLIMVQLYASVGVLILGYFESNYVVGIYAVAGKLPLALITFANLWISVLFPHAAQRLDDEPAEFAVDLGRMVTGALVIGAAVSIGAALCAGTLMPTMFGDAFQSAAVPFALLSCAAALVLLQANFSNVLLAGGNERLYGVIMTVCATGMVVLNLALIPLIGIDGAAIATIVGECALTAVTLIAVRRRIGPVPLDWRMLPRGLAAVAAMALAMLAARWVGGAIVQVAAGVAFLAAAALALRIVDPRLLRG
jgi:O-antigen/teichoic acid export membrane protein